MKILLTLLLLNLSACMPKIYPASTGNEVKQSLSDHHFVTADNTTLPLHSWLPEDKTPKAIIIAVHGFNDYGIFFKQPAKFLAKQGIASYAYDQRGFGKAPNRGLWAGVEAYAVDLLQLTALLRQKHPETPLYWLGESMGGAVALVAATADESKIADGIILAAPAIWARQNMPWYQQALLWTLARTVPWMTLTGESLEIVASDNREMLIELGQDPLVIKKTRVEVIYGVANLMDAALASASTLQLKTLLLYGEKDQIIPKKPTFQFIRNLLSQQANQKRIACYKDGYHMLLRDLKAEVVWNDIKTWVTASEPVPTFEAEKNNRCFENFSP
ncbi:MAG: lysophospholipase [Methylococcales bacterium]|nr:lysophospholipase [Methylococcales bacterium]